MRGDWNRTCGPTVPAPRICTRQARITRFPEAAGAWLGGDAWDVPLQSPWAAGACEVSLPLPDATGAWEARLRTYHFSRLGRRVPGRYHSSCLKRRVLRWRGCGCTSPWTAGARIAVARTGGCLGGECGDVPLESPRAEGAWEVPLQLPEAAHAREARFGKYDFSL